MITSNCHNLTRLLRWALYALGACALLSSALRLPLAHVDMPFVLLALVAVNVGTRLRARIPGTEEFVSHADTLLVLVVLLYGGEWAVMLGAVAALCSSFSTRRTASEILTNTSAATAATFLAVWSLRLAFGGG